MVGTPRLFENVVADVVADVFAGFGYETYVTAYSNDGGVGVILQKGGDGLIGIQVKRIMTKIKVEQIRAFAGAMLLGGYNKGIFATTSDFQAGVRLAAEAYLTKTFGIELISY
jgi:restriction system protein